MRPLVFVLVLTLSRLAAASSSGLGTGGSVWVSGCAAGPCSVHVDLNGNAFFSVQPTAVHGFTTALDACPGADFCHHWSSGPQPMLPFVVGGTNVLTVTGDDGHHAQYVLSSDQNAWSVYVPPPPADAALATLSSSAGMVFPAIDPDTFAYRISVEANTTSLTLSATPAAAGAGMTLDGTAFTGSRVVSVPVGASSHTLVITSIDHSQTKTYTVSIVSSPILAISHTGYLLDASDQPVTATVPMSFTIFDASNASVWTSGTCNVSVASGYFTVVLGATGLGGCGPSLQAADLPVGATRTLELVVGGVTLAPRERLTAAANAGDSASLGGYPASSYARFDASGRLPAVDGSQLTNVNAATLAGHAAGTGANAVALLDAGGKLTASMLPAAAVSNAHVATNAAIAVSKLAAGSNGEFLKVVGGQPTWSAPSPLTSSDVTTALGYTPLAPSGGGSLALPVNGLAVGTTQLVTSGGFVGVGTSAPAWQLDVAGDVHASGKFYGDGSALTGIVGTTQWATSGSNLSYVAGNVGIGLTNPAYPLSVQNAGTGADRAIAQFSAKETARNPRLNVRAGNVVTGTPSISFQTDSDAGIFPTLNLNAGGGNVGIGTAAPTALLEVACPVGFTNVKAAGNQLGCMETNEHGTGDWWTAANACFTAFGGRLPIYSEWYVTMNNYTLTAETGNWEWMGSGDYWVQEGCSIAGFSTLQNVNTSGCSTNSYAYRCWIPR